jgi:hypothetical protein
MEDYTGWEIVDDDRNWHANDVLEKTLQID